MVGELVLGPVGLVAAAATFVAVGVQPADWDQVRGSSTPCTGPGAGLSAVLLSVSSTLIQSYMKEGVKQCSITQYLKTHLSPGPSPVLDPARPQSRSILRRCAGRVCVPRRSASWSLWSRHGGGWAK